MDHSLPQVAIWQDVTLEMIREKIAPLHQPAVLKGLISDWPIVKEAEGSSGSLFDYLRSVSQNRQVALNYGCENIQGRFFYNQDLTNLNFTTESVPLNSALDKIEHNAADDDGTAYYLANLSLAQHMPTILNDNANKFLTPQLQPGIWIGNKVRVAPHFDVPENIACCVAGKRRFTLFPPEQISNLYIGPFDLTPSGQPVSLVDVADPDLEKFPRYSDAMKHALVAELEPGDAIYVPSLWWHQVESLSNVNLLLSYFYNAEPRHFGSGFDCLIHAMMSIRNLPETKKRAWKAYFEHYIFSEGKPDSNIPEEQLGVLGIQTVERSQQMRSMIIQSLQRV